MDVCCTLEWKMAAATESPQVMMQYDIALSSLCSASSEAMKISCANPIILHIHGYVALFILDGLRLGLALFLISVFKAIQSTDVVNDPFSPLVLDCVACLTKEFLSRACKSQRLFLIVVDPYLCDKK